MPLQLKDQIKHSYRYRLQIVLCPGCLIMRYRPSLLTMIISFLTFTSHRVTVFTRLLSAFGVGVADPDGPGGLRLQICPEDFRGQTTSGVPSPPAANAA